MKICIILLSLLSISFAKYSYSDECYRYKGDTTYESFFIPFLLFIVQFYYQYYINKKGIPLSQDIIVHQGSLKNPEPAVKYYYQFILIVFLLCYSHVLSDCQQRDELFYCNSTCESIWFKIGNTTTAEGYVVDCDPIYYKKYGDIM